MSALSIRDAAPEDIDIIHGFILALAEFEHLTHEVRAGKAMCDGR